MAPVLHQEIQHVTLACLFSNLFSDLFPGIEKALTNIPDRCGEGFFISLIESSGDSKL